MRQHLTDALARVDTLLEARERVIEVLGWVKVDTHEHLGFVSGIISSDGDEHIQRNVDRLAIHTDRIRKEHTFPIFSATDVFSPELFMRLAEMRLDRDERETHFVDFWRAILSCGHVTHVFFAPRWECSKGAMDEHETASRLGLKIYYVEAGEVDEIEVATK